MQGSLAVLPTMPPRLAARAKSQSRSGRVRRGVRLTRRGRVLVHMMLVVLLAGVVVAVLGTATNGEAAPDVGRGQTEIVVQPGGSLWSVAVAHDPTQDPAITIEEIRRLNHLSGYTVHPG